MTQVYAPFSSRYQRIARLLPEKGEWVKRPRRDLTSEEKRLARHMAHKCCSVAEIADALNWGQSLSSLRSKLVAINIHAGKLRISHRKDVW